MQQPEHQCLPEQTSAVPDIVADTLTRAAVDVAVIGAGYFGLSAALSLASAGKSVVVLEQGLVGAGASGRNGGQVQAGFGTALRALTDGMDQDHARETRDLANHSADYVFRLIDTHRIQCNPMRKGLIRGIHHRRLIPRMRRMAEADPALEFWDASRVNDLLGAQVYHGALFDPRAGQINPMGFVRGLAHAAQRAGAAIVTQTPATHIARRNDGWRIETPQGPVCTDQVVVATNTYTDGILRNLQRSLVPVNSFQIATEPFEGGPLAEGQIASDTRKLVYYYRRDEAGRMIIGGRGTLLGEGDLHRYRFLQNWLVTQYPTLKVIQLTHYWAGRVGITMDHIPHLYQPEPGLYIACGFNGKGVAMATALGERMARHLTGASASVMGLPLRPLNPILFWKLRNLGVSAHVALFRLRDSIGI